MIDIVKRVAKTTRIVRSKLTATLISARAQKSTLSGGFLLVANKGDRTLSIVNPVSGRQISAREVGGITGHEVTASLDGRTCAPLEI